MLSASFLDGVRALTGNLAKKEFRTILSFVREYARVVLPGVIINGDRQVFPWQGLVFALDQWEPLAVEVDEISRIRLVVSLGLTFELLVQFALDFIQLLQPILEAAITIVDASARDELLFSSRRENLLNICLGEYSWIDSKTFFLRLPAAKMIGPRWTARIVWPLPTVPG